MSKHTPGPWALDLQDDGGFRITGVGGHGKTAAYVVCCRDAHEMKGETHANARLIAAAPDLLAAARAALAAWEGTGPAIDLDTLRAAIAKAEGK